MQRPRRDQERLHHRRLLAEYLTYPLKQQEEAEADRNVALHLHRHHHDEQLRRTGRHRHLHHHLVLLHRPKLAFERRHLSQMQEDLPKKLQLQEHVLRRTLAHHRRRGRRSRRWTMTPVTSLVCPRHLPVIGYHQAMFPLHRQPEDLYRPHHLET